MNGTVALVKFLLLYHVFSVLLAVWMQGESADTELSRALRERDELQTMLLDFEKHMEDIQIKVKLLTSERDQLSTQYQQVTNTEF